MRKNWVRKIVRVTRADRGRMVELRQTTQEEEKLSDEAVEKLGGGGSTSNTLTKGKIGRERIYYVYVLCTNYVVFMCIFFTLLCLLATTRNPCVALQRQLSIGNYEVAFVHFINHWL